MSARRVKFLFVAGVGVTTSFESLPYVRIVPVHAMTFDAKPGYIVNPDALPLALRELVWDRNPEW
jgi:hypothetical protein